MILRPRSAAPPRPYTTPPGTNISLENHSPPSRPPHPDHDPPLPRPSRASIFRLLARTGAFPRYGLASGRPRPPGCGCCVDPLPSTFDGAAQLFKSLAAADRQEKCGSSRRLSAAASSEPGETSSNKKPRPVPIAPRRTATALPTAISCLGAFRTPAASANRQHYHSRHRKTLYNNMYFFLYFGFFVRLEARFFVPTRSFHTLSRAGAVKVGRRSDISSCPGDANNLPHVLQHFPRLIWRLSIHCRPVILLVVGVYGFGS
jgi:hypothetical protein